MPVGADQVAHVELTRSGTSLQLHRQEPGYEEAAEAAVKMSKKAQRLYNDLRKAYLERGDEESLGAPRRCWAVEPLHR